MAIGVYFIWVANEFQALDELTEMLCIKVRKRLSTVLEGCVSGCSKSSPTNTRTVLPTVCAVLFTWRRRIRDTEKLLGLQRSPTK
jgi:hypothetical protein